MMRGHSFIAVLGLLVVLTISARAQTPIKSETELLADREFEAGMKVREEGIANVKSIPWETTIVKYRSAIESFARARDLYRQAGNRSNEAHSLSRMAELQKLIKENESALTNYKESVRIFSEIGDKGEAGEQTGSIGDIYFNAQDFSNAIRYFEEALRIAREVKAAENESMSLTMIGRCYAAMFNWPEALRYWEASVKVDEAAGNSLHQAMTLGMIADAHKKSAERQKAINYFSRALASYAKVDHPWARLKVSETTQEIAVLLGELGDFPRAIDMLKTGITIDRAIGAKSFEAEKLETLGMAYYNMRDLKNARTFLEESLSINRVLNNRVGEASVYLNMSWVVLYLDHSPQKALQLAEQALKIAEERKSVEAQAEALKALGEIVSNIPERRAEAPGFKKRALELYRSANSPQLTADTLKEVGIAHYSAGEYRKAVEYLNEALMIYATLGLTTKINGPLYWLQLSWRELGNHKFATAYGKQGILALQRQRKMISSLAVESQRTYLRSIENEYRSFVRLLLDHDRLKEAHQALTAFKDAQSLDVSESVGSKPSINIVFTPREANFWKTFVAQAGHMIEAKRRMEQLSKNVAGRQPTLDEARDIKVADDALRELWKKYFEFVNAAAAGFAQPTSEDDQVPKIDENTSIWNAVTDVSEKPRQTTVAVYQMVSDNRVDLLVVTSDEMKHVRVDARGINEKARQFWALLQSDRYDPRPRGKELYDVVFKPIESIVPAGTKTIIWSADGSLRYVPMAALYDGKQYLVERFNHVTFTRTDGDRLSKKVSPVWSAVAFGSSKPHSVTVAGRATSFSSLPGVGTELNSIFGKRSGRIVDGEVLIDDAFTRKKLLETLKSKRPVVHIASHFSFRPGDEAGSFLLLGDGTAFTLADMKMQKDMFAGVELLTLSACNTAAQQPDANGREIDAFFELAQRLGAQSVLASLWPVADNSTPWLMREFYDLKVKKNENKAEALRASQVALINGSAHATRSRTRADVSGVKIVVVPDGATRTDTRADEFVIEKKDAKPFVADPKRPFAHPFYWSPFVLIGNWR